MNQKSFKIGDKVTTSGYPGTVVRHYSGAMYEVRLARGVVCVDACDIEPITAPKAIVPPPVFVRWSK